MTLDVAEHGVTIMEALSDSIVVVMDDAVETLRNAVNNMYVTEAQARRLLALADIQKAITELTKVSIEEDKEKLAMAGEWDLMTNIVNTMTQNEEALRGLYRQVRPKYDN